MLEKFASLSLYNYFYAAVLAFFITYIITKFIRFKKVVNSSDELSMDVKNIDKNSVMVVFQGDVFKRGMKVKITTMQKKVFQGEFVGKNDLDIICIVTREHIIAHEIKKITQMVSLDEKKLD